MGYVILFHEDWGGCFSKLDKAMKQRVMKKILQLREDIPARHLKMGLPFFVCELGQYRLCYITDEQRKEKTVCFVGDHKQYEKWVGFK